MSEFIKNKEWWKSKTVWGAGFALVMAVLAAMGVEPTITTVLAAVGSALGIYGRATATTSLK